MDEDLGPLAVLMLDGYSLIEWPDGKLNPAVGLPPAMAMKLAQAIVGKAEEAIKMFHASHEGESVELGDPPSTEES